jgi:hypothetical protein
MKTIAINSLRKGMPGNLADSSDLEVRELRVHKDFSLMDHYRHSNQALDLTALSVEIERAVLASIVTGGKV